MRRYGIVGSGVAGLSAAAVIRAQDPGSEIWNISDDPFGFYSRPGLAYLLSGEVPEQFLFPMSEDDFRGLKIRRWQARAERIETAGQQVVLEDGSTVPYDRLLIATGAAASLPAVPGVNLNGVIKLDHLQDAHDILSIARRARTAIVVGGGITALELVEGLLARRVQPHYLLRGSRYWNNVLDETESRIIERRLVEHGVELHFQTELTEIRGDNGRVTGIRTKSGLEIRCEMVGIAIGIQPRKELGDLSGINTGRGILVNEYLQTSDPAVYAAGDVAQVFDPASGAYLFDSLWSTAREQGRIAGLNMCDLATPYSKKLAFNVTRLAGLTTTIIGQVGGGGKDADLTGIARGDSETWRHTTDAISVSSDTKEGRLRIQIGPQTLLGAVVMGNQALSQPLQDLIYNQVDISPVRARLLQPQAPIAGLMIQFWNNWKKADAA